MFHIIEEKKLFISSILTGCQILKIVVFVVVLMTVQLDRTSKEYV